MKITAQDFHGLYTPTECDLRVYLRAKGESEPEPSAFEQVLQRLGRRHEATHLRTFSSLIDLRHIPFEERALTTMEQVRAGVATLYHPALQFAISMDGVALEFVGEPDFLIREDGGYVIRDVKMARRVDEKNHPEVLLQLQFYGWLYRQVFNLSPLRLEVYNGQSVVVSVPEGTENVLHHIRRVLKLKLLGEAPYDPVGWTKCTGCGFHDRCWTQAKAKQDVALILGVDQSLATQLHKRGIETVRQLAENFTEATLADFQRPWGEGMKKVGMTATTILQSADAVLNNSEKVLSPPAIPEYNSYVMIDLEGLPPQLDELGKIYLWGMQVFGDMAGEFQPAVAGFDSRGDEQGWIDFLNEANTIFQRCGDIPFVHWSHYEKTQIREYVRRYGDPAGVAARVLKNLLDLLPITRNSVVLPIHSYSLKQIEKYVGFERTQSEFGGNWSMAKYVEATETEDERLRKDTMEQILLYNREDLAATWAVFQWLQKQAITPHPESTP